jgi:hypothetical protein
MDIGQQRVEGEHVPKTIDQLISSRKLQVGRKSTKGDFEPAVRNFRVSACSPLSALDNNPELLDDNREGF